MHKGWKGVPKCWKGIPKVIHKGWKGVPKCWKGIPKVVHKGWKGIPKIIPKDCEVFSRKKGLRDGPKAIILLCADDKKCEIGYLRMIFFIFQN